jgi:Fur family ferric uptake transcriptional regulator
MAGLKRGDALKSSYSVLRARSLLKGIGLRSTASRIAVLQQLAAASKPLSQSDVFDTLCDFGFNRWTVFRSFSDITEAGSTLKLVFSDQGRPTRRNKINAASKTPWATNLLKSVGLSSTAARIAVLHQLAAANKPLSQSEVLEKLRDFGFDRSTIFRSLNELSEAGVTSKLDLGDLVRRFELRSTPDGGAMEHPRFMCVECGEVWRLNGISVRLKPSCMDRSRIGEITEVLLRGHCAACHTGKSSQTN